MNMKIGTYNPDGTITWPSETLAGAHYERGDFDPPPGIVHHLDATHFAVGDLWPPRGFKVQEALDKLMAELGSGKSPEAYDEAQS